MPKKPQPSELKEARLLLEHWQAGRCGRFTSLIFEAMGCADPSNLHRLVNAFPALAYAWLEWQDRLAEVFWS